MAAQVMREFAAPLVVAALLTLAMVALAATRHVRQALALQPVEALA